MVKPFWCHGEVTKACYGRFLRRGVASFCIALALTFVFRPAYAEKGINGNELYSLSSGELTNTIAGYKALGVNWVRFDFDWSVIQPTPDTYNWTQYDNVVRALRSSDIKILGIIAYTPGWANGGQLTKFYPPTNNKTFAKFASALAGRYASLGVHTWEIWNEPNLAQFWKPAADANAYAALLRHTYPAIKKMDPEAVVVTGGLAQPGNADGNISALTFLQLIYGNGAKPYFDAVGNHPYTSPQLPLDGSENNWKRMYETAISFLSIMSQYNDGNKKIWITEYGAPTNGQDAYGTVITEERQAAMVTQAFGATKSYSWAGPLFWYNYKDFCVYSVNASSECFFGLVRSDGSVKPAYDAYIAADAN